MNLDLQLFASVTMDVSYSGNKVQLGGVTETYSVNGAFDVANRADFSLRASGLGLGTKAGTVSGDFNLSVTGTSITKDGTGSLGFDGLYVNKDIVAFGFDVDNTALKTLDLGKHTATVTLTSAADTVTLTAAGNSTLGNQTIVINSARDITLDPVNGNSIDNGSYLTVKNNDYTVNLGGHTSLSAVNIKGAKTSAIAFDVAGDSALNFASGTTGAKITMEKGAKLTSSLNNAKGIQLEANTGAITFSDITASELTVNSSVSGANIAINKADTTSSVVINANNNATLALSNSGVETVAVNYLKNASITASNWKFSTGDSLASYNTLDMGTLSLNSLTGSFAGNKLTLGVGDTDVVINTTGTDSVAGVGVKSGNNSYNALIVGGALNAKQGLKLSGFNAFVGTDTNHTLDLGDVTDKKVVFLKAPGSWGETATYSNITNVKTSTVGNTLLISDMVNKETSLYGAGAGDSIYAGTGGTGNSNMVDTVGSAQGKRGWFGTNFDSGHDVIIIRDTDNKETHNFDYADAVATDAEADVLALMYGAGYIEFDSGRSGSSDSINFCIGSDSKDYMEFRNIAGATNANNYHDFFYTYDLGKNTYKARVDLTNTDTKGTLNFSDDIEFYLGQDDTKLTIGADISNENLNFNGGGVMMGIGEIDGSNGGSGNMLNGENNFAQKISASTRYATSICGGYDNSFIDIGDDTLVGGKNTTFFVGAKMGNDRIEDVDTGDKVVFLGTKYSDMTNFTSDSDRFNITFGNSAGGAAIRMETASGNTFSKVTSLTCEFDDCTLNWNGSNWVRTEK
jgi:hypothetical protein